MAIVKAGNLVMTPEGPALLYSFFKAFGASITSLLADLGLKFFTFVAILEPNLPALCIPCSTRFESLSLALDEDFPSAFGELPSTPVDMVIPIPALARPI